MQTVITVNNAYQSASSGEQIVTHAAGNLPMGEPTIAEVNDTISAGQVTFDSDVEPAFGNHIREAADTVRKLFGR
jgi:hypothetical protein